jgi:hypothetical protein
MAELRAPDPTLTALTVNQLVAVWPTDPPQAHLIDAIGYEVCGAADAEDDPPEPMLMDSDWAAWFAVPCRECFPDAPPLGHGVVRDMHGKPWSSYPEPCLSWQTDAEFVGGGT